MIMLKADIEEALADYEEAMDVAFSDWHRARAGELLAEDVRKVIYSLKKSGNNDKMN